MRRARTALVGAFTGTMLLVTPAASAQAGGAPAGQPTSGGVEYGTPVQQRPVATHFALTPRRLVAGAAAPRIRLRIDQPGVARVAARIVLLPVRRGSLLRVDLGRVPTGRTVRIAWPRRAELAPGTYRVRLHVKDPAGRTLRRTARASGRTSVVVVAPRPRRTPKAPAPPAEPAPSSPVVRAGGVFPVQGEHSYGDGFGADRGTHAHEGVDLLAAEGVRVVAPTAGTVVSVDWQERGAGQYVVMDSVDGRSFFFAHCVRGSVPVAAGAAVDAGQELCRVGNTGRSSAPHLHFEIWEGGWRRSRSSRPVDPLPQLRAWDGL